MKKIALLLFIFSFQIVTSQNKEYNIKKTNINTKFSNLSIAFCNNDFVIYTAINEKNKRRKDTDFYIGHLNNDGIIINTKRLSDDINSTFSEIDLVFTKDQKKVYFTRKTNYRRNKNHFELFVADVVTPGFWKNIKKLPFNNKDFSVANPCLSLDEKTLYFSSDMSDSMGGMDLYKTVIYDDGNYGTPKNLGKRYNSIVDDITPFIDENNVLYFSSNGRAGFGGFDIYSVDMNTKEFPVNVEELNSKSDEYYYCEKLNDNIGHFISNRSVEKESNQIYYFEISNKKKKEVLENNSKKEKKPFTLSDIYGKREVTNRNN